MESANFLNVGIIVMVTYYFILLEIKIEFVLNFQSKEKKQIKTFSPKPTQLIDLYASLHVYVYNTSKHLICIICIPI